MVNRELARFVREAPQKPMFSMRQFPSRREIKAGSKHCGHDGGAVLVTEANFSSLELRGTASLK